MWKLALQVRFGYKSDWTAKLSKTKKGVGSVHFLKTYLLTLE